MIAPVVDDWRSKKGEFDVCALIILLGIIAIIIGLCVLISPISALIAAILMIVFAAIGNVDEDI